MPDQLICLLRNLYAGQEASVRTGDGRTEWFHIVKGVHQDCILSPYLFNFYTECIMWNADLDESQAEIKISGRNINNQLYSEYIMGITRLDETQVEIKVAWRNINNLICR